MLRLRLQPFRKRLIMGGVIGATVSVTLIFMAGWLQVITGQNTECATIIRDCLTVGFAPVLWAMQLLGLPLGDAGITIGFLLSMVYTILIGFGMGVVIVAAAPGLRHLVCRQMGPPFDGETK